MHAAIVSPKGQVVIPAEIRKQLGITPGSLVSVSVQSGAVRIALERPVKASTHAEGFGLLRYEGPPRRLSDFDVADLMRAEHKPGAAPERKP
jgi:AbrB family looped-hinge helix DNA binding protein